jgi:hypothetical protein
MGENPRNHKRLLEKHRPWALTEFPHRVYYTLVGRMKKIFNIEIMGKKHIRIIPKNILDTAL